LATHATAQIPLKAGRSIIKLQRAIMIKVHPWNMSAVILNKCFITFAELSKWLDPSSDDFTTVQASTLFDNLVER
jgi:hypothetical protein